MKTPKFDEKDRKKVVTEVESHLGVKLTRVGTRRKYLRDEKGRAFWVFGGYEDWHGIPPDMMEEEEKSGSEGFLVVAKRNRNNIDIYLGPLKPLVEKKRSLSYTQKGDYQFNIRVRGTTLLIHELPGYSLSKLGAASYSEEQKSTDKTRDKAETILRKMSQVDRERLIVELTKKR